MKAITRAALGAALALGLTSVPALAQDTTTTLEQSSATTDKEKIRFANDAVAEISDTVDYLEEMYKDSQSEEDPVLVQCIYKKYNAAVSLKGVVESSNAAMQEAMAAGETGRADLEFRKIGVAQSKAQQFKAEADASSGESGVAPGVTEIDVTNDGLGDGDDTEPIEDSNDEIGEDPPGTTPFE